MPDRICKVCDRPLPPSDSVGRPPEYCSDDCRVENKRRKYFAKRGALYCLVCDHELGPGRRKFCSERCKWSAYRDRHRESLNAQARDYLRRKRAENPDVVRAKEREKYARNARDELWVARYNAKYRRWHRRMADERDAKLILSLTGAQHDA